MLRYLSSGVSRAVVSRDAPLPVEMYGPQVSPFSELMTAQRRNVFNLSAFYGMSALRDITEDQPITLCARTLTGTGTITSHFRMAEDW